MKQKTILVAILIGCTLSAAAADYKVQKRFVVPGSDGWDYISVDSNARRLYVWHGVRVIVLDEDSGAVIGTIEDTPGIHGIAIASNQKQASPAMEKKTRYPCLTFLPSL